MATPSVIDLSHHNPEPNWAALKAGGVVGVIHKATEGTGFVDPTYKKRKAAADAVGLCWSSYHFLKHGSVPQQMQHYVENAGAATGNRLIIDYEDTACTLTDLEDAVQWLFTNTLCEVSVYGSNHLVDSVAGKASSILAKTSLWQARYSSKEPAVPTNIWPTWSLWQYTDAATVAGISAKVDGNKWNGPLDKLPGWFSRQIVQPEPQPPQQPVPLVVAVNIDAPDGVNVKISVNGRALIIA